MVSDDRHCAPCFATATVGDVERALEAGLDGAARDDAGRTALHRAARFSPDPRVAALLVERRVPLEARDVQGRRALHLAAWREDGEAMVARLPLIRAHVGSEPEIRLAVELAKSRLAVSGGHLGGRILR